MAALPVVTRVPVTGVTCHLSCILRPVRMNGSREGAEFESNLLLLLRSFTGLLADRDPELETVRDAVLQHLPAVIDDLHTVCDPGQLR